MVIEKYLDRYSSRRFQFTKPTIRTKDGVLLHKYRKVLVTCQRFSKLAIKYRITQRDGNRTRSFRIFMPIKLTSSKKVVQGYVLPSNRNTSGKSWQSDLRDPAKLYWLKLTVHQGISPPLPTAPSLKLSCIPSVSFHHLCVSGSSAIFFMSASQSTPTYLKVATSSWRGEKWWIE